MFRVWKLKVETTYLTLKFFSVAETHPPFVAVVALCPSSELDRADRRAPTLTPCPLSLPISISLGADNRYDSSVLSLFFFFLSFFQMLILVWVGVPCTVKHLFITRFVCLFVCLFLTATVASLACGCPLSFFIYLFIILYILVLTYNL